MAQLEDLIVRELMRRTGLNGALFKSVLQFGVDYGVRRIERVVSEGNNNEVKVYENSGADIKRKGSRFFWISRWLKILFRRRW